MNAPFKPARLRDTPPPPQSCPVSTREERAYWLRTGKWWRDGEEQRARQEADEAMRSLIAPLLTDEQLLLVNKGQRAFVKGMK